MSEIAQILQQSSFSKEDLIKLISAEGNDAKTLHKASQNLKEEQLGKLVFFRGLVEFSNICAKDCNYCGIRKSNNKVERYWVEDKDILEAAQFAHKNKYGSLVLQSGERSDSVFIDRIENLLKEIKAATNNELGITISLGEQTEETYQKWFNAGAHRYLLRIESSNEKLYNKIHPQDELHSFHNRINCLNTLKKVGYQTGTGVMVGLPFQTYEDLANDLLFMKEMNIDMVGMGPFIEHKETPLYQYKDQLWTLQRRFEVTLNMIAILRILMPDINIAAATALQAIDKMGREKAIKIGANVIMPNITPTFHRKDYSLYENKPCTDESADDCTSCLGFRIELAGGEIGYDQWGDSKHFFNRQKMK